MNINIVQFYDTQIDDLRVFSKWWLLKHRENPNDFPMCLERVEWLEQFEMYDELKPWEKPSEV